MYDRNTIISVSGDGSSKIWDMRLSQCIHTIQTTPSRLIYSLSINPSSQIIAYGLAKSDSSNIKPDITDGNTDTISVNKNTLLYDLRMNGIIKEVFFIIL